MVDIKGFINGGRECQEKTVDTGKPQEGQKDSH